jgi:hypothetical protein
MNVEALLRRHGLAVTLLLDESAKTMVTGRWLREALGGADAGH